MCMILTPAEYIIVLEEFRIEISQNKKTLFIFDVDGVACDTEMHYTEELKLSEIEYVALIEKRKCTSAFIKTVKLLEEMGIPFIFITGRKNNVKDMTEKMFFEAGIRFNSEQIIYFPTELKWGTNDYQKFKLFKIIETAVNYEHVHFFDDNEALIIFLNEEVKKMKGVYAHLYVGNGNGLIRH